MLAAGRSGWSTDASELPRALAPYHDCARRLGLDPVAVFDQVAEAGPRPSYATQCGSSGGATT